MSYFMGVPPSTQRVGPGQGKNSEKRGSSLGLPRIDTKYVRKIAKRGNGALVCHRLGHLECTDRFCSENLQTQPEIILRGAISFLHEYQELVTQQRTV